MRCFERNQFVTGECFADFARVFFDNLVECFFNQPCACETVAVSHQDDWVESNGFDRSSEKQRCVQTGSKPLFNDDFWRASFLTDVLKAFGRVGIGQLQSCGRVPDRHHQQVGSLRIARLISVKRRRMPMAFKHSRGRFENFGNGRIIWHYKCRDQFASLTHPAPFVSRQHTHFDFERCQRIAFAFKSKMNEIFFGFI